MWAVDVVATDWRIAPEATVDAGWAGEVRGFRASSRINIRPLTDVEVTARPIRIPSRAAMQNRVHRSDDRDQPVCSLGILIQIVGTAPAIRRERVSGLPANDRVESPAADPAILLHEGQLVTDSDHRTMAHIKVSRSVVIPDILVISRV